jgi:WD40 repeat protein
VGAGKARIELSFDAWEDGRVAPATVEVPVSLLDVKDSPQLRATLRGHSDLVWVLVFAPDGKTLASCTRRQGEVKLWDVASAKEQRTLSQLGKFVHGLAFLPDSSTLASSWLEPIGKDGKTLTSSATALKGYRGGIKLWDTTTGKERGDWQRQTPRAVSFIALSPDGKTLAAREFWRENDGKRTKDNLALWDTATGKVRRDLDIAEPGRLVFSPDSKTLAVSISEGVQLFDVATGEKRGKLGDSKSSPSALAFAPDGKTLAGCLQGTVHLWDVARGVEKARLRHGGTAKACILALAFAPDGKTLAVGVGPGNVYVNEPSEIVLWDLTTHEKRLTLHGHVGDIWALVFNSDGSILASGGVDNTVKLWNIAPRSASKR